MGVWLALIPIIPFLLIFFLGGTASIKWIFMDNTPIILGGALILLYLVSQKKKEQRRRY